MANPRSQKRGIYAITIGERRDHPCFIQLHRESVADAGTDFERPLDLCGDKGPTDRSRAWLGWSDTLGEDAAIDTSAFFLRGIEVCLNDDKMKGMRLYATRVLADGTLEAPPAAPELVPQPAYAGFRVRSGNASVSITPEIGTLTRPHCPADGWGVPRFCGTGQIAVALVTHLAPGSTPRDIRGLELLCRNVRFGTIPGELESGIIGRPRR